MSRAGRERRLTIRSTWATTVPPLALTAMARASDEDDSGSRSNDRLPDSSAVDARSSPKSSGQVG